MQLTLIRLDELDAWVIIHPKFKAKILCQGAQLIEYTTTDHINWLWLSEHATYKQGQAVRGGIPICWPIFSAYDANPPAVKSTLDSALPQHGVARVSEWTLQSVNATSYEVQITFALAKSVCGLHLKVTYHLSESELAIVLTTNNRSTTTKVITQALHTYLPINNIMQTKIGGFDGAYYTDLLQAKPEKNKQKGLITFQAETDRIYHASPDIDLQTPNVCYRLTSSGSQSTVIWNPWLDKAKVTSQMQAYDYLSMLCIETANVLEDAITLAPNTQHSLKLCMQRYNP